MTVQHPRYFGYEAQVYWDEVNLFPVTPPTKYEPTFGEVQSWISGAKISQQPINVSVNSSQQSVDITPRPHAERGWMTSYMLPSTTTVTFTVDHSRDVASLADWIPRQAFWYRGAPSGATIALAFLDRSSTQGTRDGIIGNFRLTASKEEPLKGFQRWSVVAVPFDYIEYWVE